MGELAALGAAFCYAVAYILDKLATTRINPISQNMLRAVGAALFNMVVFLSIGKLGELPDQDFGAVGLMVIAGIINILFADYMYLRLLRVVDISIVMPVSTGLVTLFSVGAGVVILNEDIAAATYTGAAFVVSGVYVLSFAQQRVPSVKTTSILGLGRLAYLVTFVIMWTTGFTMMRIGLQDLDVFTAATVRMVPIAIIMVLLVVLRLDSRLLAYGDRGHHPIEVEAGMNNPPVEASERNPTLLKAGAADLTADNSGEANASRPRGPIFGNIRLRLLILAGLAGILSFGVGNMLMFFALQRSGAAVTIILLNTSILFVAAMSFVLLRERFAWRAVLGMALATAGVMLVAF